MKWGGGHHDAAQVKELADGADRLGRFAAIEMERLFVAPIMPPMITGISSRWPSYDNCRRPLSSNWAISPNAAGRLWW